MAFFDYFFPGDCYHKVIEELNFFDVQCFNTALARCLSLCVILGALGVKVPQIIKIVRSHSAKSVSYLSCILELVAVTFAASYNYSKGFPFSTWGENVFISIQVVIILMLMSLIRHHTLIMALGFALYSACVWYLISGLAPMSLLTTLQALVIPLVLSSRATTVLTIFGNGTTGQLSFITAFLNFMGTAARVFTTHQETKDNLILVSFILSFTVNGIILLQFLWYWNMKTDSNKKED